MTDSIAPPVPRPFVEFIELYPGTRDELAKACGRSRVALWMLERGRFRRPPLRFLAELQNEIAQQGLTDGSPPPTLQEFVAAWLLIRSWSPRSRHSAPP